MALTDKVLQLLSNGTFKRIADAGVAEVGSGIQSTLGNLTITGQSGFAVVFNGSAANIDVRMAGQTQANLFFLDASTDHIGLANNSPSSLLDLAGALTVRGMVAPAVSPATQGRLYFDSGTNKWRISENGAAYVDLLSSGTITGTGVNNQIAVWSGASSLDGGTTFTWDSGTAALSVDGSAVFNDSAGNRDFRVEGVTEPNLLFIDASTDSIGIGTATPASMVQVKRDQNSITDVNISNASTGTAGRANFGVSNDIHSASFGILSTGFSGTLGGTSVAADEAYFLGNGSSALVIENTSPSSHFRFAIATVEKAKVGSTEFVVNDPGNNYDFRVEGDTEPNLLFIDASTDSVGIGTATPASLLHVQKNQNGATILNLWNTTNGIDASSYYSVIAQNNSIKGIANSDGFTRTYPGFQAGSSVLLSSSTGGLTIGSGLGTGVAGANTGVIRFVTDTVDLTSLLTGNDSRTRMVITAVGKVGIGTLAPAGHLEVRDDTSTVNLILTKEGVTGQNDLLEFRTDAFSSLERHTMRWTSSSGTIGLGRYGMEYDSTANTVDFVWRDQFNVVAGTTETMRLKGNGRLGIGTSAPAYNLHVIGSALISGNLTVQGTTTTISSETMLVDDNHLYINNGYTAVSAQTGGLVVNYLPTATATVVSGAYVAGVAATSNPTVGTIGAATFTAGSFIQFSGGTEPVNNGLFEVLSHAANVLTIRGIGITGTVEDFTQNQFVAAVSDGATITKVNVSVIRAGTDGAWEVGQGLATPVVFADLAMAIGNTITSATAGSVLFAGVAGVLAQDNANFFFDDTNNRLGLGTTTPNSTMHVQGSLSLATTTITTATTLDGTHYTVRSDATGGAFTVTLPAAAGVTGRVYVVKKIDSSGNTVTVDGNGAETIDGSTTFPLAAQFDIVTIQSNGVGWDII